MKIQEQIDIMANVKSRSDDKSVAYQHKILQLLLQEKITRQLNQKLSSDLEQLELEKKEGEKISSKKERQQGD